MRLNASAKRAPWRRLTTKPGISLFNSKGSLPIDEIISLTVFFVDWLVNGAGTISTAGIK